MCSCICWLTGGSDSDSIQWTQTHFPVKGRGDHDDDERSRCCLATHPPGTQKRDPTRWFPVRVYTFSVCSVYTRYTHTCTRTNFLFFILFFYTPHVRVKKSRRRKKEIQKYTDTHHFSCRRRRTDLFRSRRNRFPIVFLLLLLLGC